ncbi:MAG: acyl-CoA dehydrogenase family protein [Pseudomonadota bacterium]
MNLQEQFDSTLSSSEQALIARARRFALERVAPYARQWEQDRRFPLEALREACAEGLASIEVPPQHGGHGFGYSTKMRVAEEIARIDFAFAFSLVNHANAMARIAKAAPAALVARLLPRLASGELIGCTALTEPEAGSDFAAIRTLARKVEGGWVLNGNKTWVTNGAAAGVIITFAQTDTDKGWRGICGILIEAERAGFLLEPVLAVQGAHAIGAGGFRLHQYFAPDESLLFLPGDGFKTAMTNINGARTYVAAMCAGMLDAGLEHAVRYASERSAFGQKVIEFQGLRWKLVDAANDLEALRLLAYRSARLIDEGKDALEAAAHAKRFAGERVLGHLEACVQAMGANGILADYPLMRHMTCAKIAAYADGSTEIMNERLGRSLVERYRA